METKPYVTIFSSSVVNYRMSLGLEALPSEIAPVDALKFGLFLLTQAGHPFFKHIILAKSQKFIFLNMRTNKFEILDASEESAGKPVHLTGIPSAEELKNSFLITETDEIVA